MRRAALALALAAALALALAPVATAGPLLAVDLGGEYMKVSVRVCLRERVGSAGAR